MRSFAMLDLTPAFNALLTKDGAPATTGSFSLDRVDEFLKEAYRIVCPARPPLQFRVPSGHH